jgi:hypothetical protein
MLANCAASSSVAARRPTFKIGAISQHDLVSAELGSSMINNYCFVLVGSTPKLEKHDKRLLWGQNIGKIHHIQKKWQRR